MPKLVSGNWIPKNLPKAYRIIFLAEKPSLHFSRNEGLRKSGNFNVTKSDHKLQEFIEKYLNKSVYITDMVKTEGVAGHDFVSDWHGEPSHKKRLEQELKELKVKTVVCLSRKVEKLFRQEFPGYKTLYINHPAYIYRYKKFSIWDEQFNQLVLETRRLDSTKSS